MVRRKGPDRKLARSKKVTEHIEEHQPVMNMNWEASSTTVRPWSPTKTYEPDLSMRPSSTPSTSIDDSLIPTGLLASFPGLSLVQFTKETLHSSSHHRLFRSLSHVGFYTVIYLKWLPSCSRFHASCHVQLLPTFSQSLTNVYRLHQCKEAPPISQGSVSETLWGVRLLACWVFGQTILSARFRWAILFYNVFDSIFLHIC